MYFHNCYGVISKAGNLIFLIIFYMIFWFEFRLFSLYNLTHLISGSSITIINFTNFILNVHLKVNFCRFKKF